MTGFNLLRVDPEKLRQHRAICNAKTQEVYHLMPLLELEMAAEAATQIAAVCNEPQIYKWLFEDNLKGLSYHPERAKVFLEWAHEGWQQSSYFVYVIQHQNSIVGAIDIKSTDLTAEIGYWLSHKHSGVMTAAVEVLQELAKEAYYQGLFAYAAVDNQRSAAVLERAGFSNTGQEERQGQMFKRYETAL